MSRHDEASKAYWKQKDALRDAAIIRASVPIEPKKFNPHTVDERRKRCVVCGMSILEMAFTGEGCVK